ncbi:hypothetical protein MBMB1_0999 [Methanobacterium sp. MB1]|jgi:hypothetical protein|nr:hypothetical protein MBMB1_0999 [Methanobacterium sp. MB1]
MRPVLEKILKTKFQKETLMMKDPEVLIVALNEKN